MAAAAMSITVRKIVNRLDMLDMAITFGNLAEILSRDAASATEQIGVETMLAPGMFLFVVAAAAGTRSGDDSVTVRVDSARHEIHVSAGPYHLPATAMMDHHAMVTAGGAGYDTPLDHFDWPVEGWLRGFRLRVIDGHGQPLPREIVHHLIVVNFSRRQLVYPAAERLLGAGAETEDAIVPKTVGIPMSPGMRLGMYVGWHNATGHDLPDVHVELTLLWTPKNQMPRPVSALPIYMDANLTVGGSNTFDVLPGRASKAFEFTLPTGGRLLGVGGHLHDLGVAVQLEDAERDAVLTRVRAKYNKAGAMTGVERRLVAVSGDGLHLKAGHRYRVAGVYQNSTSEPIHGAMAHMVGLFAPDDPARWPTIDSHDPAYQRDLASLQVEVRPDGQVQLVRDKAAVSR